MKLRIEILFIAIVEVLRVICWNDLVASSSVAGVIKNHNLGQQADENSDRID